MSRANAGGSGRYGGFQLTALVALRMLVGWHFLYEGLAKVTNPLWTSVGYLQESQGWLSGLFRSLSVSPGALGVVDLLKMKVYGQGFGFDLTVTSRRCVHLPTDRDICPGKISACPYCKKPEDCLFSGETTFCVSFPAGG